MSPSSSQAPMSWEAILGVPKPAQCNLMAACCSVATPSVSLKDLFQKAAEGDETCRDFLSVFLPHASSEEAKAFYKVQPEYVDRVLSLAQKTKAELHPEDVRFYHCRYLNEEGLCQVYEDRPTFCRDFPTSPMNILVKGCGYEDWSAQCHEKLRALGYEVVNDNE